MKNEELVCRVEKSMQAQCQRRGYAAPVDVLIDIGLLSKANYEAWRRGRVDYLERVCNGNLKKLALVMREMRICARRKNWKPSFTFYGAWGGKKRALRFSKSGKQDIERHYATHFVDTGWRKPEKERGKDE